MVQGKINRLTLYCTHTNYFRVICRLRQRVCYLSAIWRATSSFCCANSIISLPINNMQKLTFNMLVQQVIFMFLYCTYYKIMSTITAIIIYTIVITCMTEYIQCNFYNKVDVIIWLPICKENHQLNLAVGKNISHQLLHAPCWYWLINNM